MKPKYYKGRYIKLLSEYLIKKNYRCSSVFSTHKDSNLISIHIDAKAFFFLSYDCLSIIASHNIKDIIKLINERANTKTS